MRYIMQGIVMLSDILIILAASYLIWIGPLNPIIWVIVILGFKTWHDTGGFSAWNPKIIKKFLANARRLGL